MFHEEPRAGPQLRLAVVECHYEPPGGNGWILLVLAAMDLVDLGGHTFAFRLFAQRAEFKWLSRPSRSASSWVAQKIEKRRSDPKLPSSKLPSFQASPSFRKSKNEGLTPSFTKLHTKLSRASLVLRTKHEPIDDEPRGMDRSG